MIDSDTSLYYEIAVAAYRTLSGNRSHLLAHHPDDPDVSKWLEEEQHYHRLAEALPIGNAADNKALVERLGVQVRSENAVIAARDAQVRHTA